MIFLLKRLKRLKRTSKLVPRMGFSRFNRFKSRFRPPEALKRLTAAIAA